LHNKSWFQSIEVLQNTLNIFQFQYEISFIIMREIICDKYHTTISVIILFAALLWHHMVLHRKMRGPPIQLVVGMFHRVHCEDMFPSCFLASPREVIINVFSTI
jgi:hypothetical protein